MFETFSYLPPLTDEQIAAQVDYIVANGKQQQQSSCQLDAGASSRNLIAHEHLN